MAEARSDAQILERASEEPEVFGVLFDRHFATIHCYLERRIGRDGADELSGEVFRLAFEQRARFRPLHESALPWLYGLAGLEARDRDVLVLVAWEELSYDEVAAALDIPPGTVRSRLNRARRTLRDLLDDIGNEPVMVNLELGEGLRDVG